MNAFARYSTDHFSLDAPGDLTAIAFTRLTTPNIVFGLQNTFTPTLMNDVRFDFNRVEFLQGTNNTLPYSVVITGFTRLDATAGSVRNDNSFTLVDDATLIRGKHTLRAGVQVRRIQENKSSPSIADEIYTYTSTANFMNNVMDSDSYAGVVPVTGQRRTQAFGYILDQFQFSPAFTPTPAPRSTRSKKTRNAKAPARKTFPPPRSSANRPELPRFSRRHCKEHQDHRLRRPALHRSREHQGEQPQGPPPPRRQNCRRTS